MVVVGVGVSVGVRKDRKGRDRENRGKREDSYKPQKKICTHEKINERMDVLVYFYLRPLV